MTTNPYFLIRPIKPTFVNDRCCTYVVEVRNTNSGHISFMYFPTKKDALRTYPEAKTAPTEAFDEEKTPPDSNPWQDAINDLITYTIPELLLDIQRAVIRGHTISADWIEAKLVALDRDLCAIA